MAAGVQSYGQMQDIDTMLKQLIAACGESEECLGRAAKGVHREDLRNRFTGIAIQRAEFADELSEQMRKVGEIPPVSEGSSEPEREWREKQTTTRLKDDTGFLRECEAVEENTLSQYERALTFPLPPVIQPIVNRQRLAIQEALMELRDLEHFRKAS